jgi:hypothetical protein
MNSKLTKSTICAALLMGFALWIGMAWKFKSEDKLSYEPNVACIKGSPYGKIFALAIQGPIDLYWHEGETHKQHAINHDHHDGCSEGCQGHHHGVDVHTIQESEPLQSLKDNLKRLEAAASQRNNSKPLAPIHKQHLQDVIEGKLHLAYKLDPANYANYGNYHLYLSTSNLGREEANDAAALALAEQTLIACKKDGVDPASWVTAASAAYNVADYIAQNHRDHSAEEAKDSLAEFDHCVEQYELLLMQALDEGHAIPAARVEEMNTRVRQLMKLRQALGVHMKRLMTEADNRASFSSNQTATSLMYHVD